MLILPPQGGDSGIPPLKCELCVVTSFQRVQYENMKRKRVTLQWRISQPGDQGQYQQ